MAVLLLVMVVLLLLLAELPLVDLKYCCFCWLKAAAANGGCTADGCSAATAGDDSCTVTGCTAAAAAGGARAAVAGLQLQLLLSLLHLGGRSC